jgi:cellobiose phosphorylase
MYRLITESLLGLHLEIDHLRIEPLLPAEWQGFDLHYRYRETFHHIHVRRVGAGNDVVRVVVDGVERPGKRVALSDDRREHHVDVEIGG